MAVCTIKKHSTVCNADISRKLGACISILKEFTHAMCHAHQLTFNHNTLRVTETLGMIVQVYSVMTSPCMISSHLHS